jgi:hypothetical protein
LVVAAEGCSAWRAEPPTVAAAEESQQHVEPAPGEVATPGGCADPRVTERVVVPSGEWRMSATGLGIRFEGASHDSYEDGSHDLLVSLTLWAQGQQSESWLPSAVAPPRFVELVGQCLRLAEGNEDRVVLDVAPRRSEDTGGAPPSLAACDDTPGAQRLEDYGLAADGARYFVDVSRDARRGEWMPTPLPAMPLHHASRLAWQNLSDFPELVGAGGGRVRFGFLLVSREIRQVPGQHEWRAEYLATITAVCRPPEALPSR